MNLPNRLTVARIVAVPVFMVFELLPARGWHLIAALVIFLLASMTDLVDGRLARASNQVTDFGKFMDPIADKLLVTAALVGFVQLGLCSAWVVMIIVAREFLVTSLRLMAAGREVIAANIWGKAKTVSQMTAVIVTLFFAGLGLTPVIGAVLLWAAAVLTVVSGAQYVWTYREYIRTAK